MKKYRIILFSFFVFCQFLCADTEASHVNPCKDSLFIQLKTINIESMSKNELDYYLSKSSDCVAYNNNLVLIDSLNELSQKQRPRKEIIRYGFGGGLLWFLILHNNISH